MLVFPDAEGGGAAEVFFFGRYTAAAFADKLWVADQMSVLIGAVLSGPFAIEFAQMLIVIFA